MQVSSSKAINELKVRSITFPAERLAAILSLPGIYHAPGHYEYPVSEGGKVGNHLDAFFLIDPIVRNKDFVTWIAGDINTWISRERIDCQFIFAPAQPAVKTIVNELAKITELPVVYWQYTESGWFGEDLASGEIKPGSKALVFNALSLTGRCVGERLPGFLEKYGAEAAGSAAFAMGTTSGAAKAMERFQNRLYVAVDVPLHLYYPQDCPICSQSTGMKTKLTPWTLLRDRQDF